MPTTIINPKIIEAIKANVKELNLINKSQEKINKRCEDLQKDNQKFLDLMNEEYGWGNWNDVNVENYTFIPREEYQKKYYIIQNPAVQERVEIDDIQTIEGKADESKSIM